MKQIRFNGPGHVLHADSHVIDAGVPVNVSDDLAEKLAADPYLDVEVLGKASKKDVAPAAGDDETPEEE